MKCMALVFDAEYFGPVDLPVQDSRDEPITKIAD